MGNWRLGPEDRPASVRVPGAARLRRRQRRHCLERRQPLLGLPALERIDRDWALDPEGKFFAFHGGQEGRPIVLDTTSGKTKDCEVLAHFLGPWAKYAATIGTERGSHSVGLKLLRDGQKTPLV